MHGRSFTPEVMDQVLDTYPAVTKYLGAFQNHSVEIYVVLFEDLYESDHGDGEFHYPDSIFLDEATAEEYCNKSRTDNEAYHLRKCRVKVDGLAILCELSLQSFDHVTDREVLKLLTEKLIQLPT